MQVVKDILPSVKELAADTSHYVRAVLASVAMELAPVLGKQHTIEHLLPVLLSLLKDDSQEVRLNIISKLDEVSLQFFIKLYCTDSDLAGRMLSFSNTKAVRQGIRRLFDAV